MLVITRKVSEELVIGDNITVKILDAGSEKVKIGIEAPKEIKIMRGEVLETINSNLEAATVSSPSSTGLLELRLGEIERPE